MTRDAVASATHVDASLAPGARVRYRGRAGGEFAVPPPHRPQLRSCIALLAALLAPMLPAEARDRVSVVGSSTLFPFAAAVAEAFGRGGRWKTPVVESTGTGGGFKLFCQGAGPDTPDVTDASRPMTDQESAACAHNHVGPVLSLRVGYDGIVIASARGAAHFDLTREQLYRAVAGSVAVDGRLVANPYRRWSDVAAGLPERPILIFGPAPNHGTRDALAALALVPACEREPAIRVLSADARRTACQTVREDGAWIDVPGDYGAVLAKLAADPRAVAVLPFSHLDRNRDRLQAASIDGVAPTLQSIGSWSYPLARPLFLYVKTAHIGVIPGLVEFIDEFISDRAIGPDGYLVERGLAPLPMAWLRVERAKARALVPARR